jgi:molybdopterin-containing oxidoreductase family membrane subunit
MVYVGTLGLFTALFLLFVRFLPMIPMSEIRTMLPGAKITPKIKTAATEEAGS